MITSGCISGRIRPTSHPNGDHRPDCGTRRARSRNSRSALLELQLEGVVADPDAQALAVVGEVAVLLLAQLAGGAQGTPL
jgi:hypothetical protein